MSYRGVKLILDEEKISREGIYDLYDLKDEIEKKALELNFESSDGVSFWINDKPDALISMGKFVYRFLFNLKAVTDNVKEFVWMTSYDKDFDLTLLLMKQGKMPKTEKYYEYENRIKKEIEFDKFVENNYTAKRGIRLVLDEERLIKDDIYDLDKVKKVIKNKAEELDFKTFDGENFWLKDGPDALVNMGRFVYRFLFNSKAITDYVTEFIWMTSEDKDFDLTLLLMKQGKMPKTEKYYEYENRIKKEIEFDKFLKNSSYI